MASPSVLRHGKFAEIARYAVAGLGLTIGNAASYWALADLGGVHPMIALAVTSTVFMVLGYLTHARFTFRRKDQGFWSASGARFVLVRLIGLAINQGFVWLLVKQLGGPTWWPVLPMIFVTPFVIFVLLRGFVYRASRQAEQG